MVRQFKYLKQMLFDNTPTVDRKTVFRIVEKINSVLEARGSKSIVTSYSSDEDKIIYFYISIPDGEYSKGVSSKLDDLDEKLDIPQVTIIPGKRVTVKIILKDSGMPSIIPRFTETKELSIPLGMGTRTSEPVWLNLKHNPHLLIAGSTGKGKSVCLENILLHIDEFFHDSKLILVDPKRIELISFARSKKLYTPVITEPRNAIGMLSELCMLMDDRYEQMKKLRTKDFGRLGEPRLFVVIDEYADLMMVARKKDDEDPLPDIETSICRIAQLGRAAGIHLIVATQRPSVDVITGLIKNNIPTRIAFGVGSAIDSRTIIDESGAEKLRFPGLGLFRSEDGIIPFKGVFVSEKERDEYFDKYDAGFFIRHLDKNLPDSSENLFQENTNPVKPIHTDEKNPNRFSENLFEKKFHDIPESRIREYLTSIDVYRNNDAREDLGLSAEQALKLGQMLDNLGVVKPEGRIRHVVHPEKFYL